MPSDCTCAGEPDDRVGTALADLPLSRTLEPLGDRGEWSDFHRCRVCGTVWQLSVEPWGHADVPVVARTRIGADGRPEPVAFDLVKGTSRRA